MGTPAQGASPILVADLGIVAALARLTAQITANNAGSLTTVVFSATPVFNASLGTVFEITLTGNVTSSTLIGAAPGQILVFIIIQDGAGAHTFAWMAIAHDPPVINPAVNGITIMPFVVRSNGSLYPLGAAIYTS